MRRYFFVILFVMAGWSIVAQESAIYNSEAFTMNSRQVVQGTLHATAVASNALTSTFEDRCWLQHKVTVGYPTFTCQVPLSNTLYNLSVEEMINLIEEDSTWRTGKLWGGVWTRDVSYSTLLALAYMNPDVTRNSLMKKVRNGKIIQDTGTGGSWPVSTDRIVWTLAAWQVYLVTGDKKWLNSSYEIIRNTLQQDEAVVYDPVTGLVRGESSFLDWREETYPAWMQPADIAQSECLGTNAVFFRANQIVARMAQLCGDKEASAYFLQKAENIKAGINKYLWLDDKGYYGQYLYGRGNLTVSPRSEALGESLCIIFGIADPQRARKMVSSMALTPFGIPCINPQVPNVYPYHNDAVWPFVQAYWLWASALVGNQLSVEHSIACIYRAAALYTTNQENFSASTGSIATAMNSPNMLWSIAGNISIAYRILMGINYEEDGIVLNPFVLRAWQGEKRVRNFKYRKANLDITVMGYGDSVAACYIDNKRQRRPFIPANITGFHQVRVVMSNEYRNYDGVNRQPVVFSPEAPEAYLDGATRIAWYKVPKVKEYKIFCNGALVAVVPDKPINDNLYDIPVADKYTEYQVVAVDSMGRESFASEPVVYYDLDNEYNYDMTLFAPATDFAACKGYTGGGAVEIAAKQNRRIEMALDIPEDGEYLLDFRYANGSNYKIYSNQCAVRTVWYDGKRAGAVIFPQRGMDLWSNWGYSTSLRLNLKKGVHVVTLAYEPENENMNEDGVNRAMLDCVRLVRVK